MKGTLIILFLTCSNLLLFSQKKELYVNDDFEYITKTEFDKKPEYKLDYIRRFDLDSCYLNVKVSRYKKGKIKISLLDSIKKSFNDVNLEKLYADDILVINYYPGNDPCSSSSYKKNFTEKYNQFYKKINNIAKVKQLFVYKTHEGLKDFGGNMHWQPDRFNLIENTFYPIHYPCGGYVIIDSKGNYISERGEYCYTEMLIKEIKTLTYNKSN